MTLPPKDYYLILDNGTKNLLYRFDENMCLFFSFFKLDSLKNFIGLNHCKCTDCTSNKSGFSLSPNIVPMRMDDES